MNTSIKDLWEKVKKPKKWFSILYIILTLAVIAATIVLLCLNLSNTWYAYILYGVSAIVLTYAVYIVVYFVPDMRNATIKMLRKSKLLSEMLDSYGYRSFVFASFSFIINICFAIFQAVIAILSRSIWYGALATYYIVISSIRGGIIAVNRKRKTKNNQYTEIQQIKSYRNCGIYIVMLNFVFVAAIAQMALTDSGFQYAGLMIYVMATYTFYKAAMAIYNLIKAKKFNDYTLQSIKNLSLVDALVSVLALQTALLSEFSPGYSQLLPNSLTGAGVSLFTIGIGIYMIIKGNKQLKLLHNTSEDEKNNGEKL